jgi:hypothetical protein
MELDDNNVCTEEVPSAYMDIFWRKLFQEFMISFHETFISDQCLAQISSNDLRELYLVFSGCNIKWTSNTYRNKVYSQKQGGVT